MNEKAVFPKGYIAELVTPFESDGAVDWLGFDRLLERALAGGYRQVAVATEFGEGNVLNAEEKVALVEEAVLCCHKRAGVVGGMTGYGPEDIRVAREYALSGAKAVYFEAPPAGGLYGYMKKLTEAAPIPFILKRRSGKESLRVYPELFSIEKMSAVAEDGKNFSESIRCAQLLRERGRGTVVCADEKLFRAMKTFGCKTVFSRAALFLATPGKKNVPKSSEGENMSAYAALLELFSGENGSANLKWLLCKEGLIGATVRLPLCEPDFDTAQKAEKTAQAYFGSF